MSTVLHKRCRHIKPSSASPRSMFSSCVWCTVSRCGQVHGKYGMICGGKVDQFLVGSLQWRRVVIDARGTFPSPTHQSPSPSSLLDWLGSFPTNSPQLPTHLRRLNRQLASVATKFTRLVEVIPTSRIALRLCLRLSPSPHCRGFRLDVLNFFFPFGLLAAGARKQSQP
jgi:hypothetical protein